MEIVYILKIIENTYYIVLKNGTNFTYDINYNNIKNKNLLLFTKITECSDFHKKFKTKFKLKKMSSHVLSCNINILDCL